MQGGVLRRQLGRHHADGAPGGLRGGGRARRGLRHLHLRHHRQSEGRPARIRQPESGRRLHPPERGDPLQRLGQTGAPGSHELSGRGHRHSGSPERIPRQELHRLLRHHQESGGSGEVLPFQADHHHLPDAFLRPDAGEHHRTVPADAVRGLRAGQQSLQQKSGPDQHLRLQRVRLCRGRVQNRQGLRDLSHRQALPRHEDHAARGGRKRGGGGRDGRALLRESLRPRLHQSPGGDGKGLRERRPA